MDKIREEFEKFVADGCSKEAITFANIEQYSWIGKAAVRAFYDGYKSQDAEIKKLRDKVNKAYKLITSQKTCIEWNEGFDILRDIIKDGE